ncbi:hypothetical protein QYE76_069153 [Lolium multiflorum]|uniref:Integrase catalytic domain-containing protein n=1 Tax=Lolium multiflorum TaxID=4521 RepID=A0AAD8WCM6_LOLMU|nr:hypothetical protein QYE76_069153 [Lolium multiflorum]
MAFRLGSGRRARSPTTDEEAEHQRRLRFVHRAPRHNPPALHWPVVQPAAAALAVEPLASRFPCGPMDAEAGISHATPHATPARPWPAFPPAHAAWFSLPAGEIPFPAGANDAEAGSSRGQPPNPTALQAVPAVEPGRSFEAHHGDALCRSNTAKELVYNVMFPALYRCRDALQAFVQAKNAAAANPRDAALQRRADEAKVAHAFHQACLDRLNIQHGFVQPPNAAPAKIQKYSDIPLENAYEESRRQNILQNKIIAAKLGILWNGTKSPHPKSLPRFFTRVMCRQKDDSVGQLLKKLATAHVPNKDSERASDADIGRKEAGFGPIVLASNHLRGRLGSAHLDPPELNIKEKQVTAHVPAKQHCSTDVQSSSDANVCRNKTEGCGNGEAKIRRLQKDLDVATWRNKEMNRGWNSTIQDGLHAVADLQKLVAGNLVTALADADVHEINWTILEQLRFEFDEDQEEVKHVLNSLFSDCLRQYRSRLKKKYFTGKITGSVPTISPFKQMTDKQWGDLVKHWSDPKNMNLAKQNQENRGKLLLPSRATYQRTMQRCLKDQIGRNVHAYVDDIAVMTRKGSDLISDLTETFENLRRFVSRLGEKRYLCTTMKKTDKFVWDDAADAALQGLKEVLTSPPILAALEESEPMLLYLAASNKVISLVIVVKRKEEGSRKLRHYFQEHPVTVVSKAPLSTILNNADATGRTAKWGIELSAFDINYKARTAVKSQIHFEATNNMAEYEALLHGLRIAKEIGIKHIIWCGDSDLVAQQVAGTWNARNSVMAAYRDEVDEIAKCFLGYIVKYITRDDNEAADMLSKLGSGRKPIPPGIFLEHLRIPSVKGANPENPDVAVSPAKEVMAIIPAWTQPFLDYLINQNLPEDEVLARQIIRRARSYTIVEGQLYKRSTTGVFLKCVSNQDGIEILREIRAGDCGHHAAPRSLVAKAFRLGFYWLTAKEDAEKLVKTCRGCQYYATQPNAPAQELKTIPITWPFAVWGLDMVGKLKKSSPGGFEYLLVAVDKFSKWIEEKPVRKADGATVLKFVCSLMTRFGIPHSIITDNGMNFAQGELKDYCHDVGIRLDLASVAHPQSNSQVERANGLILSGIEPRLQEPLRRTAGAWADELDSVLWSLRTTPNRSTGFTPFFLVYGSAVLPSDIIHDSPRVSAYNEEIADEARQLSVDLIEDARNLADQCSTIYQQKL